ncbi:hypothetical protein H6P81_010695 [Aristolochia fimbriata]|uniref:Uncharacterized protein n=1 Tax=Aristolochia fimbriata TaxID=158543 RepID=A0AAV7ERL1_ARIFI|nr:hypothetical protein H6P81_010695 [Aristolochia fimbriata]
MPRGVLYRGAREAKAASRRPVSDMNHREGVSHPMPREEVVTTKSQSGVKRRRRRRPSSGRERRKKKNRLLEDGVQCDGSFQGDNFEILEVMRGWEEGEERRRGRETARNRDLRENAGVVSDLGDGDVEWERIGWGDIDTEEDRLMLRSAAEALQWRLKLRQWMTDLASLINGSVTEE